MGKLGYMRKIGQKWKKNRQNWAAMRKKLGKIGILETFETFLEFKGPFFQILCTLFN